MRVVAVDQGTTSTRSFLFDGIRAPAASASLRHRQSYPRPGWVEHDPLELLANVERCLAAAGPADAIGLANQGESCLAWDRVSLEPLSPVIVWQDHRTAADVEDLKQRGFAAQVAALAGLPLDSYFSASKLAWILRHSAAAQSALRKGTLRLGTTDSFLIARLTGVDATDVATASRTSLMNLRTVAWDPALCALFDVPLEALAPILPTTAGFGSHHGVPLRASIVDQQAALFGHGCRRHGDAKITFGTGAFAQALAGATAPETGAGGLIATVAWQTDTDLRYAVEGGVYDAGAAIEWAMRIGLLGDPSELAGFSASAAIDRGLVFVPALSGLACPQWSRGARGSWTGMGMATTRLDLQQSLLEGVALQTQEVLAAMSAVIDLGGTLSVDGGLASSGYFLQFLADVTQRHIITRRSSELTAYGVALLAGFRPPDEAQADAAERRYEPCSGAAERQRRIDRYRAACQASIALGAPD